MAEVLFYHLEHRALEGVLQGMLAKVLERGQRAVVQTGTVERAEALANYLWISADDAFLPHGTRLDGYADLQPIWLTDGQETPNGATVRFYVDGALAEDLTGIERAAIIFDGRDSEAVERARQDWKRFRAEGHQVSYWQQDEQGRWNNRA